MSMPFDDAALADMIDRYSRAYAGRIEILPDGAEVHVENNGSMTTYRLVRGSAVAFQRDTMPVTEGILRLALTVDRQPFGIIAVEYPIGTKEFRIPVGKITFKADRSS